MSHNNIEPTLTSSGRVTDPNLTALEYLMSSISGSLPSQMVFYLYLIIGVWTVIANCLTLFVNAELQRPQKKRNVILISFDLFTGLTQNSAHVYCQANGFRVRFAIWWAGIALQTPPAWASIFHLVRIATDRHFALTTPGCNTLLLPLNV